MSHFFKIPFHALYKRIQGTGRICLCISTALLYAENEYNPLFGPEPLEQYAVSEIKADPTPKKWNFVLYIAADNDLDPFARNSIYQMANIGSTQDINVLVHLDIKNIGKKTTKWYYIEKNGLIRLNDSGQSMDSGDPETVIRWIEFVAKNYPAEHTMLIFWNHGSGCLDPSRSHPIRISDYLVFNPHTNKYDLDRSVEYIDLITSRGICWDETTGNFLDNQKFEYALRECCNGPMGGKKFDIIGFDACLMGATEIAEIAKRYADIMVASEEVIPGTSWQYDAILSELVQQDLNPLEVARVLIATYKQAYEPITDDYTLSATDLTLMQQIEDNIDTVAKLLIQCIKSQKSNNVQQALKWCRNSKNCTHFAEPRYLDLYDLYTNIQTKATKFIFTNKRAGEELQQLLIVALTQGKRLIEHLVCASCVGKNLSDAKGISIYWPDDGIHSSYPKTSFAQTNTWYQFLKTYLKV